MKNIQAGCPVWLRGSGFAPDMKFISGQPAPVFRDNGFNLSLFIGAAGVELFIWLLCYRPLAIPIFSTIIL